jgi:hypothetical protein
LFWPPLFFAEQKPLSLDPDPVEHCVLAPVAEHVALFPVLVTLQTSLDSLLLLVEHFTPALVVEQEVPLVLVPPAVPFTEHLLVSEVLPPPVAEQVPPLPPLEAPVEQLLSTALPLTEHSFVGEPPVFPAEHVPPAPPVPPAAPPPFPAEHVPPVPPFTEHWFVPVFPLEPVFAEQESPA